MKLVLCCKQCGNSQLYQTKVQILESKRKQCVYCGKSFLVKNAIIKRLE